MPTDRPLLLLVGGGGGLVGRAVLAEFGPSWRVRSVHRNPAIEESAAGVEWVRADAASFPDWAGALQGVELVVNLAWYRAGPERRFAPLADGLLRLIAAAREAGVPRMLHVSVPPATESIERSLPYMTHKRRVDRALIASGLSYTIVRPTMLFGPRDKLLTVMMRTMARYHLFPMFGDGKYHLSPIAVSDLARILHREARSEDCRTVDAGGPVRWEYRRLTDEMFQRLGLRPRYVTFSPRGAVRLARFLETVGSSLLYAYEVEWLLSDLLGLPPYEGLDQPLVPVEPFLSEEARRLRGARARPPG
jgi:NADH dehydrogenase